MGENAYLTYYQENWDVILSRAKDYYENDKGTYLKKKKIKKREYGKNRYLNMSEEKKKRLKEYQKNYRETKKSKYDNK